MLQRLHPPETGSEWLFTSQKDTARVYETYLGSFLIVDEHDRCVGTSRTGVLLSE